MAGRACFPVLIALRRVVPQRFAEADDVRFRLFAERQRRNAEVGSIQHGDVAGEIFGAVELSVTDHDVADAFTGHLRSGSDGVQDSDLVGEFAALVFLGIQKIVKFLHGERNDLPRTGCRKVDVFSVKRNAPRRRRAESDVVEQDRVDVGVGLRVEDGEAVRVDPRAVKLRGGVLVPRDHGGDKEAFPVGSRFDVLHAAGAVDQFDDALMPDGPHVSDVVEHMNGRADDFIVRRVVRKVAGNVELILCDCRRDGFSADMERRGVPVSRQVDRRHGIGEPVRDIRNASRKFHVGRGMSDGVFLFKFEVGRKYGQRAVETAARDINLAVMDFDAVCAAFKVGLRRDRPVGTQFDDPSAGFVRRVDASVLRRINGRGRDVIFRRDTRLQRGGDVVRGRFRRPAGNAGQQKNRRKQQIEFRFHKIFSI